MSLTLWFEMLIAILGFVVIEASLGKILTFLQKPDSKPGYRSLQVPIHLVYNSVSYLDR